MTQQQKQQPTATQFRLCPGHTHTWSAGTAEGGHRLWLWARESLGPLPWGDENNSNPPRGYCQQSMGTEGV